MRDSLYAKPVASRIILRPILATLVLHLLMIAALTMNWGGFDESRTVKPTVVPKVIHARLVDVSELKPKKVSKPAAEAKPTQGSARTCTNTCATPGHDPVLVVLPVDVLLFSVSGT